MMTDEQLVNAAFHARRCAYAPYSKFLVGAALLAKSGRGSSAARLKNMSLGLSIRAERATEAALRKRERNFVALAIATDFKEPATPCGACRQVLAEFLVRR
jgi:cytidine deaminase